MNSNTRIRKECMYDTEHLKENVHFRVVNLDLMEERIERKSHPELALWMASDSLGIMIAFLNYLYSTTIFYKNNSILLD